MKRFLLLLLFKIPVFCYAQQSPWALALGYYSTNNWEFEASTQWGDHRFHLGTTFGIGGPLDEQVDDLVTDSNVRKDKTGYYLQTVDLGYSRFVTERFSIKIDLSVGSKTHYTNYSEDGPEGSAEYSYIHSRRLAIGGGLYLGFFLTKRLELYGGYSSLREAGGGVRLKL